MVEHYLGIDIGGTNIKTLIRSGKKVLEESTYKTNKIKSKAELVKYLNSLIDKFTKRYGNIKGIGIGVPGNVDSKGKVIDCLNIKFFQNIELKKILENKHKINTRVVNDGTLPYYVIKDKVKSKTVLIVTLGTGLGTSIFSNGKNISGLYFSSKFAHSKYHNVNQREELASNKFLIDKIKENRLKVKSSFELYKLATEKKNKIAKSIFKEFGENLGEVLFVLIDKYKIEEVHISGGISKANKLFLKYTKNKLDVNVKIIKSKYEVGVLGASKLLE